ncbi:hypothetical protein B0F90DRAFT_401162 [Multifurca ochricompacta]|uniref:Uncharacterized protein n=1 Tax=Multifurca ochricompacta TaxID=376703 RepID=A0AAD4M3K1_9AGAM|nr:hypothetical protein B0F90DRAFT_401162 [Multifurca ochricompacta]
MWKPYETVILKDICGILVSEDHIGRDIGKEHDFWHRPSVTNTNSSQGSNGLSDARYSVEDSEIVETTFKDWRALVHSAIRVREVDLLIRAKQSRLGPTQDWVRPKSYRFRHWTHTLICLSQKPLRSLEERGDEKDKPRYYSERRQPTTISGKSGTRYASRDPCSPSVVTASPTTPSTKLLDAAARNPAASQGVRVATTKRYLRPADSGIGLRESDYPPDPHPMQAPIALLQALSAQQVKVQVLGIQNLITLAHRFQKHRILKRNKEPSHRGLLKLHNQPHRRRTLPLLEWEASGEVSGDRCQKALWHRHTTLHPYTPPLLELPQ